ncbi:MAG: hypothetical protein GY705_28535 [Bacteroidetes bacterium]|nr:hypothetical protein [Bacteroidota bacterium]
MENTKSIFVAREYMLADDFGGVRIDEEAVFSSFEVARKFLKTLQDEEATDKDLILFRTEIIEYQIGSTDSYERKWTYNIKGELVEEVTQSEDVLVEDEIICTCKYKTGDIVYILPKVKSKYSPSTKGTYGVIVEVPAGQSGKEKELEYTIYYITENGFLNHLHAIEKAIMLPEVALPFKLRFLHLFSNYLRKEGKLDSMLISEVINEEVFVKNIKTFSFSKEKILEIHTADIE